MIILSLEDEKSPPANSREDLIEEKPDSVDAGVGAWLRHRLRRSCTLKNVRRKVPCLEWGSRYNPRWAVADLLAGITVGLTVIPQAIAYANIAGISPEYGLYSSFVGSFVYAVFGSCKDSPIGPTAIAAILTRENIHGLGPQVAIFLCLISGVVELLMGIFQLGFVIDFISGPVSVGFTSAAAIIIATTQVKDIMGLQMPGSKFIEVWGQIVMNADDARLCDTMLGIICIFSLLLLRKLKDLRFGPSDVSEQNFWQRPLNQAVWLVSTARNIIVVVACSALAAVFHKNGYHPFLLTGEVKSGLPPVQPPPLSTTVGNQTYTFVDMLSTIGSGCFVVPLLAILENIAIAKAFSDGKALDATQEMIALGLCNIASSFVGSMPVTGALSRGAVNNASGVMTPFGGVYTGILVILSLQYFTPYFYFIPRTTLAAVIIAAVIFMVEFQAVKPMWKTKKSDLVPAFATFFSCLLIRLELGILIGMVVNVCYLLWASARPKVAVERMKSSSGLEYLLVTPDRSLSFPSVEYVRALVLKAGLKLGDSYLPVVVECRHIQAADYTSAEGVKQMIEDFHRRDQPIMFYHVKPKIVNIFQGVNPKGFRYCNNEDELNEMLKECASKIYTFHQRNTQEDSLSAVD
ncbi:sodium-independent sulfate anion transporter-like isoform X2 [Neocloeon triangulifer]|nr:sodium-independent sulfate anion transporter-like isoform X2 [Neocloeon triangulifer]